MNIFATIQKLQKVNHPSLPDHPDHALYEALFPKWWRQHFTFEIKGGQEEAYRFIDNLEIFSLLANVADVKSLVIHPATTTFQLSEEELADQGITPSTIRLSIGTEHIDDIIADLEKVCSSLKIGKGRGKRMISTRGRYSIRILLDLAEHGNGEFIPMKEVAVRQGISLKYIERMMPVLKTGGLVDSLHGIGGGYRLTKRAIRGDFVGYFNSCRRRFSTGVLSAGKCGCM